MMNLLKKHRMKLIPEILMQPNIPKPLHGLCPRTIMGESWWNIERKKVYQKTDNHCIVCGVHKTKALFHSWVEAHEHWDINYETSTCTIKDIVPLCHACHNFIHSGRLSKICGKEKSIYDVIKILEHGFKILHDNKLTCFPFTLLLGKSLNCNTYGVSAYNIPKEKGTWYDWKLLWDNKIYKSKYKSYEEWFSFYNGK